MHLWIYVGCIIGAALFAGGCDSQNSAAPITVGHVSSHDSAGGETQATRAIRLALEDVNREADARPIAVRNTDTLGRLEAFAAEAVRLITISDAVALIGGDNAKEVEKLDCDLAPVLALCGRRTANIGEMVFLTDLSPESRGAVAAKFVVQELRAPYVLEIVDRRDDEARQISAAFTASIAREYKRDDPLQHKIFAIESKADITRAAERVQKTKPDAVVYVGGIATLAEIQRNLPEPVPVVFAGQVGFSAIERSQGDLYWIAASAADDSVKSLKAFRDRFKKKFDANADDRAVLAYDAVLLLARAIRDTSYPEQPDKLAESLRQIKDFAGVTGPIGFAGRTQLQRPAFVCKGAEVMKMYKAEETIAGK